MGYKNLCNPLFREGSEITCQAGAAVTGKRFVKVSATSTPDGLASNSEGGTIIVAPCGLHGRAFGVAEFDAAEKGKVGVFTGMDGQIVPVTAGAEVKAGEEVESDAEGKAHALGAEGKANGYAVTTATAGNDVYIKLY